MQTATPERDSAEELKNQSNQEASSQQERSDEQPQILALGRSNFGRSLSPVQLPGGNNAEIQEVERADCE